MSRIVLDPSEESSLLQFDSDSFQLREGGFINIELVLNITSPESLDAVDVATDTWSEPVVVDLPDLDGHVNSFAFTKPLPLAAGRGFNFSLAGGILESAIRRQRGGRRNRRLARLGARRDSDKLVFPGVTGFPLHFDSMAPL